MITWESLLGKKKEVNLVVDNAEVSHLTRLEKVYHPPVSGEVSKENLPSDASEDPVLTQMKRTIANFSIWGLLSVSKKHRDVLSKSLAQAVVAIDTSPSSLTQMIGNIHFDNVIVFSELDIPKTGIEHTEALNIAVDYGNVRIPKVLIDNGSSVNVCPSITSVKLGISPIDLAPCAQTIRAYDNTSRNVLGIVSLGLTLGAVSMKVDFYVMDIAATFNLLLGRLWIHKVRGVSSTLHQMIKFPHGNYIITIMAEKYVGQGKESDIPLLEIQHEGARDLFLNDFQIEPQAQVLNIDYIKETNLIEGRWTEYGEMITLNMLKRMKYLSGFGLGKSNKGIREFPELKEKIGYPFGLGYAYTPIDVVKYIREERKRRKLYGEGKLYDYPLRPYRKTLNGYFVREGEEVPYLLFPEPWVDKNNGRHPGFKIFEDVALAEAMEKQLMLSPKKEEKEIAPRPK